MGNQVPGLAGAEDTGRSCGCSGYGCGKPTLLCSGQGRCVPATRRVKSGEIGAFQPDVDSDDAPNLAQSVAHSIAQSLKASVGLPVELGHGPVEEVAPEPERCAKESEDTEDYDGTGLITAMGSMATRKRRPTRHDCRRLLVTHTMEMRPSSALQLIIENSGDIGNVYDLDAHVLGKGAFGIVRKGTLRVTGAVRAVKSISKEQMKSSVPQLKKEIEIMKAIDHPNLLMLNEIFEDQKALHLVLELCDGGDLQGRLVKAGRFSEEQAATTMQQIIRAVFYLHNNQVVHRDLKAANCLLASPEPIGKTRLKVSDFGLSCRVEPGQALVQVVGTPSHMAPEVIAKKYGKKCDVWSCGVITYELLCGRLPFSGENRQDLFKVITRGYVNFGLTQWLDMSQSAVSFVGTLLARDVQARCSPQAALSHQWLVGNLPSRDDTEHLPISIIDDLRKFRRRNKLKRAALHVMASMVPEAEISRARKAFISLDMNGDGLFSVSELQERMRKHKDKKREAPAGPGKGRRTRQAPTSPQAEADFELDLSLEKIFEEDFSYTEFLAATFDRHNAINRESLCRAAFSSFDKNGDGEVSIAELHTGRLLGQLTEEEIKTALDEIDADGDANMDYEEFMRMMRMSSVEECR